jgi:hypothetical protein
MEEVMKKKSKPLYEITAEHLAAIGMRRNEVRQEVCYVYGYGSDYLEISHVPKDSDPRWGNEWVVDRIWEGENRTRGVVCTLWHVVEEIAKLERNMGLKRGKEDMHRKMSDWIDGVLT